MNPSLRVWRCCCVVLAVAGAPALAGGDFRMFFVPAGDDPLDYPSGPTIVHATVGGTLRMEVFLENVPEPVRGVAADHDCAAAGGLAGSVSYEDGSGAFDMFRPDFIFFQAPAQAGIDSSACRDGYAGSNYTRAAVGRNSGDQVVTEPRYVYEFNLEISDDADGTFTFNFSPTAGLANVNSLVIAGLITESLIVSFNCDPDEADCNDNGVLDACDIAAGSSHDCNNNGLLDECDLANGTSQDINGDGYPDDCRHFRLFFAPVNADPRLYPAGPSVLNAPGLQGKRLEMALYLQYAPARITALDAVIPCTISGGGTMNYVGPACGPNQRRVLDVPNPGFSISEPVEIRRFELFIWPDAHGVFTYEIPEDSVQVFSEGLRLARPAVDPLIISLGCPPSGCVDVSDCTCDALDGCTLARCIDGDCVYSAKLAADVNRDAAVDIFDIFCVLDAFAGKFDLCTFEDTDVGGCQPDGKIDLLDIFAVLDGFEGIDACLSTCGHPVCVGSCTHP